MSEGWFFSRGHSMAIQWDVIYLYRIGSSLGKQSSNVYILRGHFGEAFLWVLPGASSLDGTTLFVEQVIKECNMLDVYAMIEGYCVLLTERVKVIEHDKVCPDELKEAISSILYAASRCGDFPELQEMRRVFTSRYGKEFASRATELRNNCSVNSKLIQKLSTRQPSLENRMMVLKEIAYENDIKLQLPSMAAEENLKERKEDQPKLVPRWPGSVDSSYLGENLKKFPDVMDKVEGFSNTVNNRNRYKDAADAAQDAFLSAAYAAAAARAAVELSRSSPRAPDNPNHNDLLNEKSQFFNSKSEIRPRGLSNDMTHHADKYSLDSEDNEETTESEVPQSVHIKKMDSRSFSSTTSHGGLEKNEQFRQEVKFVKSEYDTEAEKYKAVGSDNDWGENEEGLPYNPHKLANIQGGSSSRTELGVKRVNWPNTERKLMSVRIRR